MQPAQPPKIDAKVSKLVGKNVFINDPRLVKLVMKWKRTHSPDEVMNYLDHEVYRKELIAAFK